MQSIFDAITEWLKGLLVEGIMGNLGGLFTGVNEQVGEIAAQVTPLIKCSAHVRFWNLKSAPSPSVTR